MNWNVSNLRVRTIHGRKKQTVFLLLGDWFLNKHFIFSKCFSHFQNSIMKDRYFTAAHHENMSV